MAITLKTITGKIVIPGTTVGIRAKVTATPMTNAQALTFPLDDVISWGPVEAVTDANGILPASFKIPTNSAQQAELLWKFTAEPIDKHGGVPKSWLMGHYSIAGTGTIDLADLVNVDVNAFDQGTFVTLQSLVASASASATSSAASATSAAASASVAHTLITTDLGTTDGQSFALVTDTNSLTGGALTEMYVGGTILAGAGIDPTGATDSAPAIQAKLDVVPANSRVYLPTGSHLIGAALSLATDGVSLYGPGKLVVKDATATYAINITAADVTVDGIQIDGRRSTMTALPSHFPNDLIRVTGDRCRIVRNRLADSWGGAVSIYGAAGCVVAWNDIRNTYDNGVLVAEVGADDNLVAFNTIDGTTAQNGIFFTASSASTATGDYIYRNRAIHNTVTNCGDTAIEAGIHSVDTEIAHNTVDAFNNPGLLLRDVVRAWVHHNKVEVVPTTFSDAIAVVPQTESGLWPSDSVIEDNRVTGTPAPRACVHVAQDGITVRRNTLERTAGAAVTASGDNLSGRGVSLARPALVRGNTIRNFTYGVDCNYGTTPDSFAGLAVEDNDIEGTTHGISLYNLTLTRSRITGNRLASYRTSGIFYTSADGSHDTLVSENTYDPRGFTTEGAPPEMAPPSFVAPDSTTVAGVVPTTQFDVATLLATSTRYVHGLVAFGDNLEHFAEFRVVGGVLTAVANSATVAGSIVGFDDWGVGVDAYGQIILTRRGATVAAVGRYSFTYQYR